METALLVNELAEAADPLQALTDQASTPTAEPAPTHNPKEH